MRSNGIAHGTGPDGPNRPAAEMEDTEPMTRQEILEAVGAVDDLSAPGTGIPDRTPPDPVAGDEW